MKITNSSPILLLAFAFVGIGLLVPQPTQAATRPSCSIEVTTSAGTVEVDNNDIVMLLHGEEAEISWESKNAKEAFDEDDDEIDLDDSVTVSPSKTTTYEYLFKNGSRRTTCEVTLQVVSGDFNESTLTTKNTKPTISGTASGTKSVQVKIYKDEDDKKAYVTSRVIKVKNNKWSTRISKRLAKGDYLIELLGEKRVMQNTIATNTLTIGTESTKGNSSNSDKDKKDTTLVVASVPLLGGGVANAGKTVPISYLQVVNPGKVDAEVKGFTIKQNGSAKTSSVIGLTVTDDKKSFLKVVGGTEGSIVFKDGSAFIPVDVTIPAGERRLFTIKAMVTNNVTSHVGLQLRMDVAGVDTNSKNISGKFPVRGTTWTLMF